MKKNEDELKNEDVLKNCPPTPQQFFFKTSHLDIHTAYDVKPEMLSGVQTGKRIPHGMCEPTEKTTFSCKDD